MSEVGSTGFWRCNLCTHVAPTNEFYNRDDKEYYCPTCKKTPTNIPRLRVLNPRTGLYENFYTPTPKQILLHTARERNVLWGGRAGTGKSWALRNDAYMRCLAIPNYKVLLLRRQFTELRDTHLNYMAIEAAQLGAVYRATENTIVFSNGSRLRAGHVENDDAVKTYLSSEFDCILWDEGSTFTEYQFRFINSRLRTTKVGVVPICRVGSNPGAMWLYRYFISKDIDTVEEDPSYRAEDYRFIPAEIADNPHVNLAEQEMRLNSLPSEALRKMYRDGDWLAVEGQFFTEWAPRAGQTGDDWHVIHELPLYDGKPLDQVDWIGFVRVIDWGYDPDEGVCTWFACMPSGRYIAVKEWTFKRTIARLVAEGIAERSEGMRILYSVGGRDMWSPSNQTGETISETFARKRVSMRQADTDRINGWQRLHALLTETMSEADGESVRSFPMLQVFQQGCPSLTRTIPMMQNDPRNPGDMLQRQDHWVDTARYFAMSRPVNSRENKSKVWDRFPPNIRKAMMDRGHAVLGSESARHAA